MQSLSTFINQITLKHEGSEYVDIITSEEEVKKKYQLLWTRVWNSAEKSGNEIAIFSVNEDLRRVRDLSKKHDRKKQMKGSLIWSPKNFSSAVKDFDVEEVRLS